MQPTYNDWVVVEYKLLNTNGRRNIVEDQQIVGMYLKRDENAVAQTKLKYTIYCRAIAIHIMQSPEDADEVYALINLV